MPGLRKVFDFSSFSKRLFHCLVIVVAGWLMVGCAKPWRPGVEHVNPNPLSPTQRLSRCLQADRLGWWIYQRREFPVREDDHAQQYVRIKTVDRLTEGLLVGEKIPRLKPFLRSLGTQPASKGDPPISFGKNIIIYWELEEALPPIPFALKKDNPVTDETGLRYYNYLGQPGAKGTLKRVAALEGMEDVECPAGTFKDCFRVRVELDAHFPWIFSCNLTSFLWLSPKAGEVRRVQHVTGWFLIFWFGSAQEYQLVSNMPTTEEAMTVEISQALPEMWKTGLIVFDRGYPRVRVGGMTVDLGDVSADGDDGNTSSEYDRANSSAKADKSE